MSNIEQGLLAFGGARGDQGISNDEVSGTQIRTDFLDLVLGPEIPFSAFIRVPIRFLAVHPPGADSLSNGSASCTPTFHTIHAFTKP
jgi:hypothetical protein